MTFRVLGGTSHVMGRAKRVPPSSFRRQTVLRFMVGLFHSAHPTAFGVDPVHGDPLVRRPVNGPDTDEMRARVVAKPGINAGPNTG